MANDVCDGGIALMWQMALNQLSPLSSKKSNTTADATLNQQGFCTKPFPRGFLKKL